ncbi:hypothetical protein QRD43_07380 [Pelomonas sp. APW6]|uniref:Uncharacterized protein n=1 Tax=Roseateles subflavus TaxID=3053353 RepID=A0ABT7LFU4_9BURK|nr:hypothetical protein [Pelomonas sp. APW6]MDL5031726.1 hypothetical protein [Pelomonas sp. APW6]
MGQYVVLPSTPSTDCGRFRAAVAVRRIQGGDGSPRTLALDKTFSSREAAKIIAVTQGWFQTPMPTAAAF